jgi:hypothetical protein
MSKIVRCHWDADGLISAYLTSVGLGGAEIQVGNYSKGFGATYDLTKNDYMVDMKPQDPEWEGTCIDHHPGHPPLTERKYSLTWETKPASILCWQKFKDTIPKKEWWKTVMGAVGDGQAEKVPYEIWKECPELMQKHKTFIKHSYGKWQTSFRPAYQLLSSGINAFARYGEFKIPLNIIEEAESPSDIINDSRMNRQKSKLSNTTTGDFAKVLQDAIIYPLNNITLCIYNSPIRLAGYIASVLLSSGDSISVLAVNELNGSLSLRGDNANYIKGELNKLDYVNIDGHDGFAGGKITKHPNVLYKDMLRIL